MNFIFILILALASNAGHSQTKPTLTLKQAIHKGLSFSLEVKQAESDRRQADANYRLAESKLFPSLTLNASGGTQKASSAFSRINAGTTNVTEVYRARLDLEQPLFTGGVVTAGLSAAKLERDESVQLEFAARQDYTFHIIDNYFKVAQSQILLDLARDNRAVLKSYFDITTRYAAIGRSKNIDRLQAEANFNMSEADVLEAESELDRTREDFIRVLGDREAAAAVLDTKLSVSPIETGTLDQLLERALENNPEIRALELQASRLRYENRAKMVEYRPRLSLRGSYGFDSPDRVNWFDKPAEAYSLTLNLSMPIFNGFGSFAQSDSYAEDLFRVEKSLAIKRQDLQRSLAKALATIKRDFERLKLTRLSATSSRKAMDVAVRDYRNGLLSSTDVLNIQRTRFEAERQYIVAQYSYNIQVLRLRLDLGSNLEKIYENNP